MNNNVKREQVKHYHAAFVQNISESASFHERWYENLFRNVGQISNSLKRVHTLLSGSKGELQDSREAPTFFISQSYQDKASLNPTRRVSYKQYLIY